MGGKFVCLEDFVVKLAGPIGSKGFRVAISKDHRLLQLLMK